MSDEAPDFNLKFNPPVPAYFTATFDMGTALELIIALREHVNNADNPGAGIRAVLTTLEDQYPGDGTNIPTGIGDPIDEDGLAAA